MAVAAQTIIKQAQLELQDPKGVRWSAADLVAYLHAGQMAILTKRPDQNAVTAALVPVAGARQTLPTASLALIDIHRNTAGRKRTLTKVDSVLLDAVNRDWRSMQGTTEFLHFCHDLREPRVFLLYPPALPTGASVEVTYCAYPAQTPTASGRPFSTVTGNIDLPDEWANALRYYVLYRAWSVDMEAGANSQMASTNYQLFKAELGEQIEGSSAVSPKD